MMSIAEFRMVAYWSVDAGRVNEGDHLSTAGHLEKQDDVMA
jgi:hypothetical protein